MIFYNLLTIYIVNFLDNLVINKIQDNKILKVDYNKMNNKFFYKV